LLLDELDCGFYASDLHGIESDTFDDVRDECAECPPNVGPPSVRLTGKPRRVRIVLRPTSSSASMLNA
jgi:hypothetical protein